MVRGPDTKEDLARKVKLATILGTIQATYTHFPYLRKVWKDNTEEERLLGVSLTGVMDNVLTNGKDAGLPAGFYDSPDDFAGFIGQDTSAAEIKLRADAAARAVNNTDPAYTQALRDIYGIDEGMMAAFMLDAERARPLIEKQAKAVEFGTAAVRQGLQATRVGEQFAQRGPATGYTADQGYSAIAGMLPTASKLGQVYGQTYDQATAEQEVFSGLESAKRKRQKLGQMETATFSGQSGVAAGSLKASKSGQF